MDAFCSEVHGDRLRHALVVDLSEDGLRIQRPLGGPRRRTLQLELEIPGVDEIVWACGEIRFDQVWQIPPAAGQPLSGLIRTSGVRLISAASRHQRLLREYVHDTWRQHHAPITDTWLAHASCYQRG